MQNSSYSGSLSASDSDGDILTYSVVSGPSWLVVESDGSFSGTPLSSDIGVNTWTFLVTDSNGGYGGCECPIWLGL